MAKIPSVFLTHQDLLDLDEALFRIESLGKAYIYERSMFKKIRLRQEDKLMNRLFLLKRRIRRAACEAEA